MNKNELVTIATTPHFTPLAHVAGILTAVILCITFMSFRDACADTAIYIDPRTGQITSESPVDDNPDAARRELQIQQVPEAEPQEAPSPVPGGGIMVEDNGGWH